MSSTTRNRKNSAEIISDDEIDKIVSGNNGSSPYLALHEIGDSSNNNNNIKENKAATNKAATTTPRHSKRSSSPLPFSTPLGGASAEIGSSDDNNNNNNSTGSLIDVYSKKVKLLFDQYRISLQSLDVKDVYSKIIKGLKSLDGKKIVSIVMLSILSLLILDTLLSSPENRLFKPDFSEKFLLWVQDHPATGVIWILLFMSIAVIFMVPIGTPITVGCGYIYKGAYGWKIGVTIATLISTGGSAIGAVTCFLLGRYLMRNQVRKWIRKYPLFDAIDAASAEHGLRIMAMLYLTPIVPLGPISYMCGTTSMSLSSFIIAKIASLPLMILYVIIGASTSSLIGKGSDKTAAEVKKIEENKTLIISGILLSFVMIGIISTYIKKELNKILDRQQKHKPGEMILDCFDESSTTVGTGEDDVLLLLSSSTLLKTTSSTIGSNSGPLISSSSTDGSSIPATTQRRQHVRKH